MQNVPVQKILDGARTNLPLMEEVAKKAQKAKSGLIYDTRIEDALRISVRIADAQ